MMSAEQPPDLESGRSDDAVVLSFPGRPDYLRLARLAAADTGARAGFSIEDLENLRIAVDELSYAIMGEGGADEVTLRYSCSDGYVEVEGACVSAQADRALELSDLARAIVGAIADEHVVGIEDGMRRFRFVIRRHA